MNKLFDDLIEIIIGLLGAFAFSIILYIFDFFTIKHIIAFILPAFIIIAVTLLIINRYKKIGLWSWRRHKGSIINESNVLKKASNNVDIIISENIYNFFNNDNVIEQIDDLVSHNIKVRILIPRPFSEASQYYSKNNNELTNQMIEKLLRLMVYIKTKHIDRTFQNNLKIAVYSKTLHWCAIFIDNKYAYIDLYSDNYLTSHPYITIKTIPNVQAYYEAFHNAYNVVWNHARRIFTVNDVNRIVFENAKRINGGIIIAITGPSGAGKTTITKKLLAESNGSLSCIHTYTTRLPRENSEIQQQYNFVTIETYKQMDTDHKFVISADFCGNKYGIVYSDVFHVIDSHKDLLLDTIANPIELKNVFGNRIIIIYITAATNNIMVNRIKERGTQQKDLKMRIDNTKQQSRNAKHCDYIVINKDIDITVNIIKKIISEAKKQYIQTGDIITEEIIEYTSSEVIGHGLLPEDEVLI